MRHLRTRQGRVASDDHVATWPCRFAGGIVLFLAFTLTACGGSSETIRPNGAGTGDTLRITLADEFGALIGNEMLGASEVGSDQLEGDLTQAGSGKWRGVVTATANRTIDTAILGTPCRTELKGSQEVEVLATLGTYEEDRNLRLVLTPKSPPEYTTYPSCSLIPMEEKAPNGIEWLWFYFDYYRGGNVDVHLPDKPGGTWTWDFAPEGEYGGASNCEQFNIVRCRHSMTLKVEYR